MENVGCEGDKWWEVRVDIGEAYLETDNGRGIGAWKARKSVAGRRNWDLNSPERTKMTPLQSVGSPGARLT